jgi:hypothetical protein
LSILANDIDVIATGRTVGDRIVVGGAGVGGSYANRVRWTGGNIGSIQVGRGRDLLLDDVYAFSTGATSSTTGQPLHNFTGGWDGSSNLPFERLAIVNSTLEIQGEPGDAHGWAFYSASNIQNQDLFVGNAKFLTNQQTVRCQNITRFIFIDSCTNPNGGADGGGPNQNGFRLHAESNHIWFRDSWARGFMMMNFQTVPNALNVLFDNFDRYNALDSSFSYLLSPDQNTGEYRNCTLATTAGAGDGTFTIGNLVNGGGNVRTGWDGTTVPDYSLIGAIR